MPIGVKNIYPPEVLEYIRNNYKGVSTPQLLKQLQERFDVNYSLSALKAKRREMGCSSGIDTRFKPGNPSPSQKGVWYSGCEKGWFKKGSTPHNHMPVGSEVVSTDGYVKVKVAEPKVWKFKHIMVWTEVNGPVPPHHAIIFRDRDRLNCDIDNLMLVHKRELAVMNKQHLLTEDADLNEAALATAKLIIQMQKVKEKSNNA